MCRCGQCSVGSVVSVVLKGTELVFWNSPFGARPMVENVFPYCCKLCVLVVSKVTVTEINPEEETLIPIRQFTQSQDTEYQCVRVEWKNVSEECVLDGILILSYHTLRD